MPVADMPVESVLGDDLAHIGEDFRGGRDRRRSPRLETIAEGVKVAVGADAGKTMRQPGAAKALLGFKDDKAGARELGGEVIGAADAGDTGADDQDVEMFDRLCGGHGAERRGNVHGV